VEPFRCPHDPWPQTLHVQGQSCLSYELGGEKSLSPAS
jgi:hypothetical protein